MTDSAPTELTLREAFEQNAITARTLEWTPERVGTLSSGELALYRIVKALLNEGDFDWLDSEWKRAVTDGLLAATESAEEAAQWRKDTYGF